MQTFNWRPDHNVLSFGVWCCVSNYMRCKERTITFFVVQICSHLYHDEVSFYFYALFCSSSQQRNDGATCSVIWFQSFCSKAPAVFVHSTVNSLTTNCVVLPLKSIHCTNLWMHLFAYLFSVFFSLATAIGWYYSKNETLQIFLTVLKNFCLHC